MNRDVSGESPINLLFRVFRAIKRRLRGRGYSWLGFFSKGTSSKIYIDAGARFFNSRQMFFYSNVAFGFFCRIEVHNKSKSNLNVKLHIGNFSSFGDYCHIGALESVSIGSNVLVGSNVLIIDHSHGRSKEELSKELLTSPRDRELFGQPIIIEDNVWIGDGAVILGGAIIGEGAVIAAGSVIKGKVAPRSIYFGMNSEK